MAHVPSSHEIETVSGRYVDTSDPRVETIALEDIAHALSMTCRYGGHCRRFYSVAEHAVAVSHRVERRGFTGPDMLLAALHHDDAEAYLGDIPRPMKPLLGVAYAVMSERMDKVIADALDLDQWLFHHRAVKAADNWLLFVEARALLKSQGRGWLEGAQNAGAWGLEDLPARIVTPDYFHGGMDPQDARALFLARHAELVHRKESA